jgi:hypothetical protein
VSLKVTEIEVSRTGSGSPVKVQRYGDTACRIVWGCSQRIIYYEKIDELIPIFDAFKSQLNVWVKAPRSLTGVEEFAAIFIAPGMLMVENRATSVPPGEVSTADWNEVKKAIKKIREG